MGEWGEAAGHAPGADAARLEHAAAARLGGEVAGHATGAEAARLEHAAAARLGCERMGPPAFENPETRMALLVPTRPREQARKRLLHAA